MPQIFIQIANKRATLTTPIVIVTANSDYEITFDFDSEWDDFDAKTLEVKYIDTACVMRKQEVLFEGDTVALPVLHNIREVAIGVYAGNLHTSTPAVIPCERSISDGDAVHDAPTPDVYVQLLAYIQELATGVSTIAGDFVFDAAEDDVNFADVDITYTPNA